MQVCVQMWAVRTFLMVNPFVTCVTVMWKLCMRSVSHGVATLENVITASKDGINLRQHTIQLLRRLFWHGYKRADPERDLSWSIKNVLMYKYAMQYIDKHEQKAMRVDALADKLLCNNVVGFWKEVIFLNGTNTSLPGVLEGVSGSANIAELCRQH